MIRTIRILILAALGALVPFEIVQAQDTSKQEKTPSTNEKPVTSLKVGDLAPALTVAKWLQGEAVPKFEPGRIYVLEFWATWCNPCIGNMPHLAALQRRYQEQGVRMIAFTSRDIQGVPDNTEEKVMAFVKRRGPALGYAFAYADDSTTTDAWLTAAGRRGFSTFVIDRAGRIAYIGHPMFVDLVLHRLVGGASAVAVGDELAQVIADYEAMHQGLVRDFEANRDLKPGLLALKEFQTKYPPLADLLPIVQAQLSLLPKHGNPGEGKEYAEALVAKSIHQKNVPLLELAYSILRNEKDNKEYLALARKAAEAQVQIDGGTSPQGLLNLADAFFASGDKAKAKEYAQKARAAAAGESASFQQYIEMEAQFLITGEKSN